MASQARSTEHETLGSKKIMPMWSYKPLSSVLDLDRGASPLLSMPRSRSPTYKLFDLNRKLLRMNKDCDITQWNLFADEFFDPNATLTIAICLESGPKRFTIGRTLIPRFYSLYCSAEVSELQYELKHVKEHASGNSLFVECPQGYMTNLHKLQLPHHAPHHPIPIMDQMRRDHSIRVSTECRFSIEFMDDCLSRIKNFSILIRSHSESIPRHLIHGTRDSEELRRLQMDVTRGGLPVSVLNFLQMCNISEPMIELMARNKGKNITPRDCLREVVQEKFMKMTSHLQRPPSIQAITPPEEVKITPPPAFQKPAVKRRRRKNPEAPPANKKGAKAKSMHQPPNYDAYHERRPPTTVTKDQNMMFVVQPTVLGLVESKEECAIQIRENSYANTERCVAFT